MKKYTLFIATLVLLLANPCHLLSQTDTLVLQPGSSGGKDANFRTDLPNTNYGSQADFIANAWTAQGNFFIQRSLIQFDLTPVPPGSTVHEAILDLYTNLNTGHYQLDSGPNASYFMRVMEPWLEDQVTWNNQPQATMSGAVIVPQSISHTQTYHMDLTKHVQDMVDNPESNFGWLFRLQTEEKYRCLVFSASDHYNVDWRPRLTIIYDACTPPEARFSANINFFTVEFTDHSLNAESWFWDFGDGDTSNLQNPVHVYPEPGIYQVCLKATNSCGDDVTCSSVNIICVMPVAGFYYESSYPDFAFFDTSYAGTVLHRLWDFGDGDTSTVQNPVHEYALPGNYQVCLAIRDSCGTDIHCEMISFNLPLAISFSGTPSGTDGLLVFFTDFTVGSTWWKWSFGDGAMSTIQNPSHLYQEFGAYEVCLEAGNQTEQGVHCDSLELKQQPEKPGDSTIILFPNPANESLSIQGYTYISKLEIRITNVLGKNQFSYIYKDIEPKEIIHLDLGKYPPGKYFVTVRSDAINRIVPLVIY